MNEKEFKNRLTKPRNQPWIRRNILCTFCLWQFSFFIKIVFLPCRISQQHLMFFYYVLPFAPYVCTLYYYVRYILFDVYFRRIRYYSLKKCELHCRIRKNEKKIIFSFPKQTSFSSYYYDGYIIITSIYCIRIHFTSM